MKPSREISDLFHKGEMPLPLKFGLNAPVVITHGPHVGKAGFVVHVQLIAPEVVYLVELENDELVDVFQKSLRRF